MKTYKKNRIFFRIYSDGARILEGCTDFPGSISFQEAQTLAGDIDAATDKLMGEHVKQHGENIPESEEPPAPLKKPSSEGKPYPFSVLLTDRNGKQELKQFNAHDGDFFVIHKSPWNGGIQFREATREDYEELGDIMPSEDALKAQFEKGMKAAKDRCIPRGHPQERGYSGAMIDKETPVKRIADFVQTAWTKRFDDYNDMHRYYEQLRNLAQEGLDEEADKWHYRNAKFKAERIFTCYHECKVRNLPERKQKAICKKCRRNPDFEDNFTDGKEQA